VLTYRLLQRTEVLNLSFDDQRVDISQVRIEVAHLLPLEVHCVLTGKLEVPARYGRKLRVPVVGNWGSEQVAKLRKVAD